MKKTTQKHLFFFFFKTLSLDLSSLSKNNIDTYFMQILTKDLHFYYMHRKYIDKTLMDHLTNIINALELKFMQSHRCIDFNADFK